MAAGHILIDTTTAKDDHLSVGSTAPVKFALGGTSTMRVGGIFQPNALIGHYLVGSEFFLAHFTNPLPIGVLLKTDGRAGIFNAVNDALRLPIRTSGSRRGHSTRRPKSRRSTSFSASSTPSSPSRC